VALIATALWPSFRQSTLGRPWVTHPGVVWAGWGIAAVTLILMLLAQISMGRAFRIGQDDGQSNSQDELQQSGFHAFSRNPIYAFSALTLFGMTLWSISLALVVSLSGILFLIHQLVLDEEKFLSHRFGVSYASYQARVPRYFGFSTRPDSLASHETQEQALSHLRQRDGVRVVLKSSLILVILLFLAVGVHFCELLLARIVLWILMGFFLNGIVQLAHEAWHYNLFRSIRANRIFGHFLAFLLPILYEPSRHAHLLHHRYNRTARDPDAYNVGKRSAGLIILYYVVIFLGLPLAIIHFSVLYPVRHFSGQQLRRHVWQVAGYGLYYACVAWFTLHFDFGAIVWETWVAPILFTSPWNGLKSVADHFNNDWNGSRYRTATDVDSNALVRYFWSGLNFHLDHHLYPDVPGHNLPKLHAQIRGDLNEHRSPVYKSYAWIWSQALRHGPVFVDDDVRFISLKRER
jgi:fatty acid desaturase/protein-S-isoprenylcysteine O-methyltransferase Ste14